MVTLGVTLQISVVSPIASRRIPVRGRPQKAKGGYTSGKARFGSITDQKVRRAAMSTPRDQSKDSLRAVFRPGRYSHIFIDADDTLWYDGHYFRKLRGVLLRLTADMGISEATVLAELERTRSREASGEGGYASAIVRTAHQFGLSSDSMKQFEGAVLRFRHHPIELLSTARATIVKMSAYSRMLLTKGNQEEQERKLGLAGLTDCFDEVVVVGRKNADALANLCAQRCIHSSRVLVIGNSVRHDIVPAVEIGAGAIWINHAENEHGRNDALPSCAYEVESWETLLDALQGRQQDEDDGGAKIPRYRPSRARLTQVARLLNRNRQIGFSLLIVKTSQLKPDCAGINAAE